MNDSPFLTVLMIAAGVYVTRLWIQDMRAAEAGTPIRGGLPGAVRCARKPVLIAIMGALVLLAAETWGEIALGLDQEQSEMTVLFGIYTLSAAIIEEIIFRGYVVIERRGKILLWLGIFGASLVFAALHPFLWEWDDGEWTWTFNAKGWFSTGAIFLGSLWFYFVRFMPANPNHSLLPCFAAHFTKNLGVFGIKGVQGFVTGLW
jgi:uncharacterized protein